ncbi:hypothetical protein [Pseudoxanthomonas kaohsiungensis]|uniref:KfrA N-terminal DNA-binding domain-containing protein n=1 Tax=Pseudoxanthomonas kaohsiungensis TaxID=283923 RepID=A0ABW3M2F5_9GAMM|nr:hypothetical protein [Pseudoxanthomonas kaohsiungensis]KAF1702872.1 hypothetical protein CSC66_08855 [Pseudoxanthomonas kaohsiungensis]
MKAATFSFEGQELTVAQIREHVPVLGESTIRSHLRAGRNTRAAMLNFNSTIASRQGGREAAERARKAGSETRWSGRGF